MRIASTLLSVLLAASVAGTTSTGVRAQEPARHQLLGIVRGADRQPTAEASVTIRWRAHPELPGLCGLSLGNDGVREKTVTTDARGRFRTDVPVRGPFELLAKNADGSKVSIRRFPVMSGGFVECDLVPAPWIGGTVTDKRTGGEPAANFGFALEPFEQTWARHRGCGSPVTRYRVTTDENGTWRCIYPSGYLRERFWEPYLVPVATEASLVLDGGGILMPDARHQRMQLEIDVMKLHRGQVLGPNSQPVAGARVFDPYRPQFHVRTDDNGEFAIRTRSPGRLHATAPGLQVGKAMRNAGRPGRIALAAARPLSAALRDAEGKPLASRPVLWCDWPELPYPPLEHASKTNERGEVGLGLADEGATAGGLGPKSMGFVSIDGVYVPFVAPAGKAAAPLTVRRRTLEGTIVDGNGTPLANARITARSREEAFRDHGDPLWVTYSDHGGRWQFASLPQGKLVLVASADEAGYAKTEIRGGDDRIALQTGEQAAFELEVLDQDEKACSGVWVTLTSFAGVDPDIAAASPSGSAALCGFTDDHGKVAFHGVPGAQWFALAMRVHDGKIEATDLAAVQRDAVTRIALSEHKD